jgi:hypothetical protein
LPSVLFFFYLPICNTLSRKMNSLINLNHPLFLPYSCKTVTDTFVWHIITKQKSKVYSFLSGLHLSNCDSRRTLKWPSDHTKNFKLYRLKVSDRWSFILEVWVRFLALTENIFFFYLRQIWIQIWRVLNLEHYLLTYLYIDQ